MDVKEIRKIKFRRLAESAPSKAAFAEKIDTAPAYVSQILSSSPKNPRNIGDKIARRIEKIYKKPRGWMDTFQDEDMVQLDAETVEMSIEIKTLAQSDQALVKNLIRSLAKGKKSH
jgi:hypothetical protein